MFSGHIIITHKLKNNHIKLCFIPSLHVLVHYVPVIEKKKKNNIITLKLCYIYLIFGG